MLSGARIGAYQVVSPLGKGGMGEVYRARDAAQRESRSRSCLEPFAKRPGSTGAVPPRGAGAGLAQSSEHRGDLRLEEADGVQALVLELVEGQTLAERIAQGRSPLDEALAIAQADCRGARAAHEKGIIHRDLKPANIK